MFTVTLVSSVVFFSFALHNYLCDTICDHYNALATSTTTTVAGILSRPIKEENFSLITEKAERMIEANPEILYIVLGNRKFGGLQIDSAGQWNHLFPEDTPDSWMPDDHTETVLDARTTNEMHAEIHRCVTQPVLYESIPEGKVCIGFSLEPERQALNPMLAGIVVTGLLTIALGLILSILLSRHLTHPIKSLRAFALEIARGNLGARVANPRPDEIGDLEHSMNLMAARLEESRRHRELAREQESALREKDILLREIHHRVKNNMQILSSLLRMQSRSLPDKQLAAVLSESETRIRSMALIHEKLYQSEQLSGVPLQAYLETLCSELLRMYGKGRRIEIDVQAHDISLELDTALPCGLIVNELVSNALKYAFPDASMGYLLIELSAVNDGLRLTIHDNGIGLPEDLDIDRANSLGLKLVRMLVAQLDGTLELDTDFGTRFEIRFQEASYEERI